MHPMRFLGDQPEHVSFSVPKGCGNATRPKEEARRFELEQKRRKTANVFGFLGDLNGSMRLLLRRANPVLKITLRHQIHFFLSLACSSGQVSSSFLWFSVFLVQKKKHKVFFVHKEKEKNSLVCEVNLPF